ncbi:conserved protein of unknown function [Pararobbsia alpina]|uniref:hypothetical protein n=1 Tax=Pararobbsia alpina TaxID=621374 RepID=UPI0039A4DB70
MRHVSTKVMVERLSGLINTNDLSAWEQGFVMKLKRIADAGHITSLSDKQVEALDELHAKHFSS